MERFLSVATARWEPLGEYGEHRLTLLDLTGNPATGTTKTFASLMIVARAVEYIRRYGEAITIFSPPRPTRASPCATRCCARSRPGWSAPTSCAR
nr:hypothetical protein GCM10020093_102320 [Planobispora longispora]